MKNKLIILFISVIFNFISYGQSTHRIKDIKNITSGKIVAINRYVSGTTMDLKFTITYQSDGEYGDYVEMIFPNELVPITASDPLVPLASGSTNPLSLNNIDGHKISWGSQNDFGGMNSGTYDFFVTVNIDAAATGNLEISYTISGDEFGDAPHEVSGTINIEKLPNVPDLKPIVTDFFDEYYAVPFDQVTSTVKVKVINIGATLNTPTYITVKNSDNSYNKSLAITIPMNTDNVENFVFTDYIPAKYGKETFIFKAEAPNDYDKTNSVDTAEILITETELRRDNGIVIGNINAGRYGDIVGNIFTIGKKDTLNSVISFHVDPEIGDSVKAVVYSLDENGKPETLLGTSLNTVYTGPNKEYITFFENGIILNEGKYLIGLKGGSNNLKLGITSTPYIEETSWAYYNNSWRSANESGYKYTYYIRPQFGTKLPEFDIELLNLNIYKYAAKNDKIIVKGTLHNKGFEALTSIDLAYSVNGGTPIIESFTNLDKHGFISFEMATKITVPDVGNYNIKVYLSNPNGSNDVNLSNDTLSTTITVVEYAPSKRVFCEEGTGTWCGWCVAGHVYMDSMEQKYPNTWIGVAVHHNDIMSVNEYSSILDNHINSGYPSGLLNRLSRVYGPNQFESAYLTMINQVSPVELSLKNINYNKETRELTFDVNAKFLASIDGARFNAIILENEVTGTTNDYDQKNYYSGGEHGNMGGYENLPNPVPADQMVYQHVARAGLGGWNGTENSIPQTVSTGEEVSYTYNTTIDNNWDYHNIEIVGFILANNGTVLNAVKSHIGTNVITSTVNNIIIYPNPFNNTIIFDNMDNVKQVIINNIMGQKMMTININTTQVTINTSDFNSGIYLINIIDNNNNVITKKIIKQ